MKILLDEMFTGFKDHFEVLGWEAKTVDEVGLVGAEDRDVAKYAIKHDLVLVSEDKRSMEIVKLLGGKFLHVDTILMVRAIKQAIEEKYRV